MGWTKALFSRLTTVWSSNSDSSSSYPPPVFAVDRTEVAVSTATAVPEPTLRELNKATRSFSATMLIGRGRNLETAVYRASLPIGNDNGSKIAAVAKRLGSPPPHRSRTWTASDDEFLREQVLVLSRLRHDNVVRLLGYTIDSAADVRALLFEFADMGTLYSVLHGGTSSSSSSSSRAALSWAHRAGIALDVARGLEYLHDAAAVSHWGISSTKVLLFHGFRAKIADYDLFLKRPNGETAGNMERFSVYDPLEYVVKCLRRSSKSDVYSYGVLLLELLTGRKGRAAMRGRLQRAAAPVLREGRIEGFMDPKLGTQYPPARALTLTRIVLCCVQENPELRPSMGAVAQMISCHIPSSETTTS